ncbi:hypothetical protein B4U79_17847 [Dinothrombium tinctorium]|uniref:RING-CH-type domain-containing protein n=1 Tax=Dinothrombium tinctorium TaxID=1965070 RepID=A0A3S3QB00_9ACAR|nr:hypothetical protein B4U79_17847 [Dinothrombium tinctorium]
MMNAMEDEIACRICLRREQRHNLITPCLCRGSLRYVHGLCLKQWILWSACYKCEICKAPFIGLRLYRHENSLLSFLREYPLSLLPFLQVNCRNLLQKWLRVSQLR